MIKIQCIASPDLPLVRVKFYRDLNALVSLIRCIQFIQVTLGLVLFCVLVIMNHMSDLMKDHRLRTNKPYIAMPGRHSCSLVTKLCENNRHGNTIGGDQRAGGKLMSQVVRTSSSRAGYLTSWSRQQNSEHFPWLPTEVIKLEGILWGGGGGSKHFVVSLYGV